MAGKNTSAFGIYPNRPALEMGIQALRDANFRHEDISVLLPENLGTKDFAHEKDTKAPEGAVTGAGTGGVVGGVLGWLAGIGALAIPGLGPFISAGPLMGGVNGAAAKAEFSSRSILKIRMKPNGQRRSSSALALKILPQPAKRQ